MSNEQKSYQSSLGEQNIYTIWKGRFEDSPEDLSCSARWVLKMAKTGAMFANDSNEKGFAPSC